MKQKLSEYENLVNSTAVYPKSNDRAIQFLYLSLALNGEAGEIAEKIKKISRDEDDGFTKLTNEQKRSIAKELGDVLWYITALGNEIDYNLTNIMELNTDKILARRKTGTLHGSGDNREE